MDVFCAAATGCADLVAPRNAWVRRVADHVTVTCNRTSHTWHLVCKDTAWVGQTGDCNQAGMPDVITHCLMQNVTYSDVILEMLIIMFTVSFISATACCKRI